MGNQIIDILIEGIVAFRRGHLKQDKALVDMIEQLNELKQGEVGGNKRPDPKDCDHDFEGSTTCQKCGMYEVVVLKSLPKSDTIKDAGQD